MNRTRFNKVLAPFAVRFSILLGIACLLPMASRLTGEVTSNPTFEIFRTSGEKQIFRITVPFGKTLASYSVLTLGAPNLDFKSVPRGTNCPDVVAGSCAIEVQFQPTAPGKRLGAVVLSDASGNVLQTVSLVGIGKGPMEAFGPGIISTFVGNGKGADGGLAAGALLAGPTGIATDGFGNLYIADEKGNKIRKVTPSGVITTFAGTGSMGYSGDGRRATSARLSGPMAVLVDGAGFVYIADTGNNVIRLVNTAGIISTYAGQYYAPGTPPPPVCSRAIDSAGDGCPGNQIVLNMPVDMVFCNSQNLHIADKLNNRIRTVLRITHRMITQVGNGIAGYNGDGELNTRAELNGPTGVAMDAANNIYVADTGNYIIRKTLLTGTTPNPISTVAGTPGSRGNVGDGGRAINAQLNYPRGVQVDAAGNIYISDSDSHVIRKVDVSNGLISTIAGTATAGYSGDGGPATRARLNVPSGILLDTNGNLYIADSHGTVVRKVDFSNGPSFAFTNVPEHVADALKNVSLMNLTTRH
jgi:sugar lactone lactonase YvrE